MDITSCCKGLSAGKCRQNMRILDVLRKTGERTLFAIWSIIAHWRSRCTKANSKVALTQVKNWSGQQQHRYLTELFNSRRRITTKTSARCLVSAVRNRWVRSIGLSSSGPWPASAPITAAVLVAGRIKLRAISLLTGCRLPPPAAGKCSALILDAFCTATYPVVTCLPPCWRPNTCQRRYRRKYVAAIAAILLKVQKYKPPSVDLSQDQ